MPNPLKDAYGRAMDGEIPPPEQHCPGMAVSHHAGLQWCQQCGASRLDGCEWMLPLGTPIDDVTRKCLLTLASQAELWCGELMADAAIDAGLTGSVETPKSAAFAAIAQKLRAIRNRGHW